MIAISSKTARPSTLAVFFLCLTMSASLSAEALPAEAFSAETWPQAKYDSRRSGNAAERTVDGPLKLAAAAPLGDAVFTSPAVADGKVYIIDGSGTAWCLDAKTLETIWRVTTEGGAANCNNVSSPTIAGDFVHFGTTGGNYYVLNRTSGEVVKKIPCGEPIFSAPVAGNGRVYFATLGGRVFALDPDGTQQWTWDFVHERLAFDADRYSGVDWLRVRKQAGWREQFCVTRDIALVGKTLVVAAGGTICWLDDAGDDVKPRGFFTTDKREAPATLGMSVGEDGEVYRQWHRRDNGGRVEVLALGDDGKVKQSYVKGTTASYAGSASLSFSSVSMRGKDVFRCRPEEGFGLCLHAADGKTTPLAGTPSIAGPILLKNTVVCSGLDGSVYFAPIDPENESKDHAKAWKFETPFRKAITAPVAVCDGRVYFGCDDGYVYALSKDGRAKPPSKPLDVAAIRHPLTAPLPDAKYDWFTNFGNLANTNSTDQELKPPFKIKWIRRFKGTVKHMSVFGGGRMYTHTAEGQIFAVEQETGRLLWRRYFPGVHVSFTAPIYFDGKLLVPQAGLKKSRLRCFDAATGDLLWEAPFTGSPSWNRQLPPLVHDGLVIYQFSSGKYPAKNWLFEHQSTFGFPKDQKPLVKAWDFETGKEVWTQDLSKYGAGGDDAGMCLLRGKLYYSCYFGGDGNQGVTARLDAKTGEVEWATTKYYVHAGCTISGEAARIYLGGYNPVAEKKNCVWCLNAADGSLVWESEPLSRAIHVITIGKDILFTHSQYRNGFLIDKKTGKILTTLTKGYRCTRFTLCEPYLLGPNLTVFDLTQDNQIIQCGPAVDVLLCVGMTASNGRLFYTTNGAGLQVGLAGEE